MKDADYPQLAFADAGAWREWLDANHAAERGVWVILARAASDIPSVSRDQALDVALCYGWIDGQARSRDGATWLQKYTPRRPRSAWSKRNRERVERLMESGEMHPAGLDAVEAARTDGRWERAYDSPATATVPEDLRAALDASRSAATRFESLTSAARFAILHRVQTAVRPETRARRISQFVAMLERGESP